MDEKEKLELEGDWANSDSIKRLWQRIKQTFVRKDGDKVLSDNNFSDEDKAKLDNLTPYELPVASDETLGGIKIGTGLAIDENGVVSVESAGAVEWEDIQNTPTTLQGYGITDAATKEELQEVKEEVSHIFNYCGSVETYNDLLAIQEKDEGDVYDVREDGKNYRWTLDKKTSEYFWDDLGGTFKLDPLTPEDIDIITGYATTEATFDEILKEGGEIELGSNLTLSNAKTITEDTVIDLSGYDISSTIAKSNKEYLFTADGATLTFKGDGNVSNAYRIANATNGGEIIVESGTFRSGDVGMTAYGANSSVTFNGGELEAVEGGIGAFSGASIEVNGGVIDVSDNFALFTNGKNLEVGGNTIVVNDGVLIGNITSAGWEACGVYIANHDTFVMNGGEIRGVNGCGLCMRGGDVTINAGRIECSGTAGTTGKVADSPILMGKSAVIYHESANYPGKEGMKLTINGGEFIGVDHSVEVLSNEAEPQVFVNGGEFTPAYPEN